MKSEIKTWHIHITGLVQGIGFRPLVYNKAVKHDLPGWVKNDNDGLHIEINASKEIAFDFYNEIISQAPVLARITSASIAQKILRDYQTFDITHDTNAEHARVDLTPDFATCNNCTSEMTSTNSRRYNYPFITCCECGPRYSIIHHLPYDRENTKMDVFEMCDLCRTEYNSPADRRHYAQTNSCPTCSIQLSLYNSGKEEISKDSQAIIQLITEKWDQGKIVAIKGIGGYLITCDASNPKAIENLRQKKRRPDKPMALMYPNANSLKEFNLTEKERITFSDPVSPILLLTKPKNIEISKGICNGLSKVGIMIPYAPLFQLLLDEFKKPIVSTSGNVSNSPIVFKDEKALNELFEIADYVLVNNREIVAPQDDSVVTFTPHRNQKVVIRRSRGMAPSYFNSNLKFGPTTVLSMGAFLKSTFAIQQNEKVFISQYLGDLDNYETDLSYQHTLDHLLRLLDVKPELIVADLHSNYSSTIRGVQLSEELKIPLLKVQHHIAHFSALLGEHALLETDNKILGVIWDGTGLGIDGNIWGGEFFIYRDYQFDRCAHLPYFQHIANDKMPKEPRLSALAMCHHLQTAGEIIKSKFSTEEWKIYHQLLRKERVLQSSSMGRLFDAVASMVGLIDIQTYEGQAASLLQGKAEDHFNKYGMDYNISYFKTEKTGRFSVQGLIKNILSDFHNGIEVNKIAAKFHLTLVHWIRYIAKKEGVEKIGFSGGVFQNTLLIDLIIFQLADQFELLFHKDLSPNDENISFGQLIYAEIDSNRPKG